MEYEKKYIDADLLRKEVKRLEKAAHKSALGCADSETRKFHEGKDFAYQYIGILINSLQQEQPDKSLEEEIARYLREKCSEDDEPSVSEIARYSAEWGAEHLKK